MILAIMAAMPAGCGASGGKDADLKEPDILSASNHLEEWEEELLNHTEERTFGAAVPGAAVRGLVIQIDGETVFAVSYEPGEGKESFDYWDIPVPYHSLVSLNTEELYELFGTAVCIPGGDSADISPEEAGITESKTSVFLAYDAQQKDGEKGAPRPTAARRILIGKEDGTGHYYAAFEGEAAVYLAEKEIVDAVLNADPYQYILKIPALVSVSTVERVQIISDDQTHVMKQADGQWEIDKKSVGQEEFQELYGKLLGIMISGRLPEDFTAQADRKTVLTLQFFRNVDGASDIEVVYYEYDEEFVSVSVNGQEFFLAEKSQVEDLVNL